MKRVAALAVLANTDPVADFTSTSDAQPHRPRTRGDCDPLHGKRPASGCPFISCRHHMFSVDVGFRGGLTIGTHDVPADPSEADLEAAADALAEQIQRWGSCSLDIADRGAVTLEEVGERLNVTRERIRQIEAKAFRRVKRALPGARLGVARSDLHEPTRYGPEPKLRERVW